MTREYLYDDKFCHYCHKRFESKYFNAKFCSDAHRALYGQKKKQSEKLAKKILKDIQRLQEMDCKSESVSQIALRIQKIAGFVSDEWEYVKPIK